MIEKIISGGQIGADQAGLRVARAKDIATGGWAPKDFMTLAGPDPELETIYGLEALEESGYTFRTHANVNHSDATVRFAHNFNSPGERCTYRAIRRHNKPWFDVTIAMNEDYAQMLPDPYTFAAWLVGHEVKVLNVAGNASRDIEEYVCQYLSITLEALDDTAD